MTTIAIHQPNFLPWLGYFAKMQQADIFVLLDDAAAPKTGSSWTNRVRIVVQGDPAWLTAPLDHASKSAQTIMDLRFATHPWRAKVWRTVESNYRRAAHFEECAPWVRPLVDDPEDRVGAYNAHAVTVLMDKVVPQGPRVIASSSLGITSKGTQRLIDITQALDGDAYLSGAGATAYQDEGMFAAAGVRLRYTSFEHPTYTQGKHQFHPGISVIDALFHLGTAEVAALLGRSAQGTAS